MRPEIPSTPAVSGRVPPAAWFILILASLDSVLGMIDRQAVSVLKKTLKDYLQIGDSEYGILVTAFLLAYAVFMPICGRLVDRFGSRTVLTACVVIWSAATMASGLARTFEQMAALRALLGAAEAGLTPATIYALVRWFPRDRVATVYALRGPIVAFGPILAPPVIAGLALVFGWRGAFLAPGTVGLVFAFLWWMADRSPPDYGEPPPAATTTPWRDIFSNKLLWGLLAARAVSDPVWFFIQYWQAGYFEEVLGLSLAQVGALLWIPPLAGAVMIIGLSVVSDQLVRRGRDLIFSRVIVMQALAVLAPLLVIIPLTKSAPLALGLFTAAHVMSYGFITLSLILVAALFPKNQVATAAGIVNCVGTLAAAGFNLVAGSVVEAFGYSTIFMTCAVLHPLAAGVLYWAFMRRTRTPAKPAGREAPGGALASPLSQTSKGVE